MKSTENNSIVLKDGRALGYALYGDLKGMPIFYFHGWPTSRLHAYGIDFVAKKLAIKLISPDRPGIGLSDYKKNRTLLDWPDDVVELACALGIKRFGIMGVSGGGPYAAVCAYKIPHLLSKTAIVVGLAPTYIPGIMKSSPLLTRLGWTNYGRSTLLRHAITAFYSFNAKYGPSLGFHRFLFGAKKDKQAFADPKIREMVKRGFREAFKKGSAGVEQDLEIYTTNWKFDLKKINTPVFLFYGEVDQNVPLEMGKYYASQIFKSNLMIYKNEGHLIAKIHADEILKTLISAP